MGQSAADRDVVSHHGCLAVARAAQSLTGSLQIGSVSSQHVIERERYFRHCADGAMVGDRRTDLAARQRLETGKEL